MTTRGWGVVPLSGLKQAERVNRLWAAAVRQHFETQEPPFSRSLTDAEQKECAQILAAHHDCGPLCPTCGDPRDTNMDMYQR